MMKETLFALVVGFAFAGLVGCSSAPKTDGSLEQELASTEQSEAVTSAPEPTLSSTDSTTSGSTSSAPSDLSLGAGSSGRGH